MTVASGLEWNDIVGQLDDPGIQSPLSVQNRIARQVGDAIAEGRVPANVVSLRIAMLRSFTVEPLLPPLVAQLARRGFAASIRTGRLGDFAEEILRPDSFQAGVPVDATVVFVLPGALAESFFDSPPPEGLDQALEHFLHLIESLAENSAKPVIVANFARPESIFPKNFACRTPEHGRYRTGQLNYRLAQLSARHPRLFVWDIESLANRTGLASFWSARDYATSMQPFSAAAISALSSDLAGLFALVFQRSPVKCVVVDCDNTLWRGIAGEDGPQGIQMGDTYPGSCYRRFQNQLGQLRRLGYLLAIVSKNDEQLVRSIFEQHPDAALKWEDLAAVRVNWVDKPANLREIARELNLGLDSLLFLDDNDFELEMVRSALPEVRCVKVPPEPWLVPSVLPRCEWIDCLSVTDEDQLRAASYGADRKRRVLEQTASDHSAYLRDLKMVATLESFSAERHLSRASQLTRRTNQFNLTTRRYTDADLLAARDQGAMIFLGALTDRFGDYGRVLLAILKPRGPGLAELDTFLVSCRAIGRTVEDAWFQAVLRKVEGLGYASVRAEFIPSSRNTVCADFLPRNGFELTEQCADGRTLYERALGNPAADHTGDSGIVRIESIE